MAMKKRAKKAARAKPARRSKPVARPRRPAVTAASARSFVLGAALPQPRVTRDGAAEAMSLAEMGFETAKNQAAVVGSEIQSFVTGVTAERRDALANSSLLAQLMAKNAVPDPTDIDAWYRVYFDTLTQVGWNIQDLEFKQYEEESESFNAHEAILKVAATLLAGPRRRRSPWCKPRSRRSSPWTPTIRGSPSSAARARARRSRASR